MAVTIIRPILRHRSELGYAVGLGIGFLQMLYLDYKIEKNFQNQMKRIHDLNNKTDDLAVRVKNICNNLK